MTVRLVELARRRRTEKSKMKSMTGYGKSVVEDGGLRLTVEIKSVNNRYIEINCRMPKMLSAFEDVAKKAVKSALSRGSVDLFFSFENGGEVGKKIVVDELLAESYVNAAKSVGEKFGIKNDLKASEVLRFPDVIRTEAAEFDEDALRVLVTRGTQRAVESLVSMRAIEGATIKADLTRIIDGIDAALAKAEERAPKVVSEYAEKIRIRITELLDSVEIDEARLVNEVAFFADKADINEEISRLHSHIAQFRDALESDKPQGRNLDFISQEIGREINTMGSKSNDAQLTSLVVLMKNELEKIKEQIRNVE